MCKILMPGVAFGNLVAELSHELISELFVLTSLALPSCVHLLLWFLVLDFCADHLY